MRIAENMQVSVDIGTRLPEECLSIDMSESVLSETEIPKKKEESGMSRLVRCMVVMLLGVALLFVVSCQTVKMAETEEVAVETPAAVEEAEPEVEEEATEVVEEAVAEEVVSAGVPVAVTVVDLSPVYDWSQDDFDKAYAPEIEGEKDSVEWKTGVKLDNGAISFLNEIEGRENIAIYARVILEADEDCKVHLSMGSDDGLAVFVNGKNVFRNNVMRPMTLDQDKADIELMEGENEILFRVTQGGGGFSLQVAASVMDDAEVVQVMPPPAVEEDEEE